MYNRNITIQEILDLTFTHKSKVKFSHPDIDEINSNINSGRHERTSLGLWTTTMTDQYSDSSQDFGCNTYEITPKDKSKFKVLILSNQELYNLYANTDSEDYVKGTRTAELRNTWKDYDMLWMDELEQIFLKFDNINFKLVS